jgi:hypothetical protein
MPAMNIKMGKRMGNILFRRINGRSRGGEEGFVLFLGAMRGE